MPTGQKSPKKCFAVTGRVRDARVQAPITLNNDLIALEWVLNISFHVIKFPVHTSHLRKTAKVCGAREPIRKWLIMYYACFPPFHLLFQTLKPTVWLLELLPNKNQKRRNENNQLLLNVKDQVTLSRQRSQEHDFLKSSILSVISSICAILSLIGISTYT